MFLSPMRVSVPLTSIQDGLLGERTVGFAPLRCDLVKMMAYLGDGRHQERSLPTLVALGHEITWNNGHITPTRPGDNGQVGAVIVCYDDPAEAQVFHELGAKCGPYGENDLIRNTGLALGFEVIHEGTVERFQNRRIVECLWVELAGEFASPFELIPNPLLFRLCKRLEDTVHTPPRRNDWEKLQGPRQRLHADRSVKSGPGLLP